MDSKPVVALDLDGTLFRYHEHFIQFAEQWLGRRLPDATYFPPNMPLCKYLGISKATYRKIKLAYRLGGLKRSLPAYPGATELVREIRKAGAEVWVCTTRPYLSMENIEPDTREALRRNGMHVDGLLFGPHKYNDLIRNVPAANVVAVLEDLPELCHAASNCGLPVYIRDQPYNRGTEGYIRVNDFQYDPWRIDIRYTIRNHIRSRSG